MIIKCSRCGAARKLGTHELYRQWILIVCDQCGQVTRIQNEAVIPSQTAGVQGAGAMPPGSGERARAARPRRRRVWWKWGLAFVCLLVVAGAGLAWHFVLRDRAPLRDARFRIPVFAAESPVAERQPTRPTQEKPTAAVEPPAAVPRRPGVAMKEMARASVGRGMEVEIRAPDNGAIAVVPEDTAISLRTTGEDVEAIASLGVNPLAGVLELTSKMSAPDQAVAVEITWPKGSLSSEEAERVHLYHFAPGSKRWDPVLVAEKDVDQGRLVAELEHFSSYVILCPATRMSGLKITSGLIAGEWASFRLGNLKPLGPFKRRPPPLEAVLCDVGGESCAAQCTAPSPKTGEFRCQPTRAGPMDLIVAARGEATGGYSVSVWAQRLYVAPAREGDEPQRDRAWKRRAREYAPVLKLHAGERYLPVGAENLYGRSTTIGVALPAFSSLRRLTGAQDITSYLESHGHLMAIINRRNSKSLSEHTGAGPAGKPVVYWHVEEDAAAAILTYWLLFAYDPKSPELELGWHPFDRESVSVVFARDGDVYTPAEVVYAGHIPGQSLYLSDDAKRVVAGWDEGAVRVPWSGAERGCSHPVAYVALGSHALYPRAGSYVVDARIGRELRAPGEKVPASWIEKLSPVVGFEPAAGNGISLCPKGAAEGECGASAQPYALRPFPSARDLLTDKSAVLLAFSGYWVDGPLGANGRLPPFVGPRFDAPLRWYRGLASPGATPLACPADGCARCESFEWLTRVGNRWVYEEADVDIQTNTSKKKKVVSNVEQVVSKEAWTAVKVVRKGGSRNGAATFLAVTEDGVSYLAAGDRAGGLDGDEGPTYLARPLASTPPPFFDFEVDWPQEWGMGPVLYMEDREDLLTREEIEVGAGTFACTCFSMHATLASIEVSGKKCFSPQVGLVSESWQYGESVTTWSLTSFSFDGEPEESGPVDALACDMDERPRPDAGYDLVEYDVFTCLREQAVPMVESGQLVRLPADGGRDGTVEWFLLRADEGRLGLGVETVDMSHPGYPKVWARRRPQTLGQPVAGLRPGTWAWVRTHETVDTYMEEEMRQRWFEHRAYLFALNGGETAATTAVDGAAAAPVSRPAPPPKRAPSGLPDLPEPKAAPRLPSLGDSFDSPAPPPISESSESGDRARWPWEEE